MEANTDCPFCDKRVSLKSTVVEKAFKKEFFTINEIYYKCDSCGEEFTTEKTDEVTVNQVYNQYREKFGLPFPEEFVQLREKYEISAQKMSQIFGLGINTYSNYEKGEIPTSANAKLITSAKRSDVFLTYLNQSRELFNSKTLSKLEEKANGKGSTKEDESFFCNFNWYSSPNKFTGYMIPNPEKATNLLLYFISNCNPAFNDKLKLNKLLFYADFLNYKVTGKSISGITYRAISYGPVPTNYDFIFAHFTEKEEIIEPVFIKANNSSVNECFKPLKNYDLSVFNEEEVNTLKKVIELFKDTPSWDMVELSYKERAWIELNKTKSIISYQDYAFDISINE